MGMTSFGTVQSVLYERLSLSWRALYRRFHCVSDGVSVELGSYLLQTADIQPIVAVQPPTDSIPQIVFVSALFYLLSWSDEHYLPVQWVMDLLPHLAPPSSDEDGGGHTKDQGEAFQRAIRWVGVTIKRVGISW